MAVPEHTVHYLEIVTPDVESLCRLYGEAYGWSFKAGTPELGNARVAELPDGSLCGIRAPLSDTETPIVRTYLRVSDIDAAVEAARRLGAEIALEPVPLGTYGTIAIYLCGGVQQGIWQTP